MPRALASSDRLNPLLFVASLSSQANSAKTEAYCELTEKDRNSARVIEKRMRRLIKLQVGRRTDATST